MTDATANPLARLLADIKDQLHNEDPTVFHGTPEAQAQCERCNPPAPPDLATP